MTCHLGPQPPTPPMHTELSAEGGGKQGPPTRQPAPPPQCRASSRQAQRREPPSHPPPGGTYQMHSLRGAVQSPRASVSPPAKWGLSELSLEQHLTHAEFSGDIWARGCGYHCAHSSPLGPATSIAKGRFKDTLCLGHLRELPGGLPTPSAGDEKGPVNPLPSAGLGLGCPPSVPCGLVSKTEAADYHGPAGGASQHRW